MAGDAPKRCAECGFDWSLSFETSVWAVVEAPERFAEELADVPSHVVNEASGTWSAAQYLWHLVDVLRYGTERLRTLALDPDAGAMPWDADLAMEVRARSPHSVRVGLAELRVVAREWERVALDAPQDVTATHPDLGAMSRLSMVRRNAHEVIHHSLDVGRGASRTGPGQPR